MFFLVHPNYGNGLNGEWVCWFNLCVMHYCLDMLFEAYTIVFV